MPNNINDSTWQSEQQKISLTIYIIYNQTCNNMVYPFGKGMLSWEINAYFLPLQGRVYPVYWEQTRTWWNSIDDTLMSCSQKGSMELHRELTCKSCCGNYTRSYGGHIVLTWQVLKFSRSHCLARSCKFHLVMSCHGTLMQTCPDSTQGRLNTHLSLI